MTILRSSRLAALLLGTLIAAGVAPLHPGAALAQAIVTSVNGDPITTFDVDEHVKLLKLDHKPAGRNDALEDAIADHLKYDEARKGGVDASDSDIQSAVSKAAESAKMTTEAWLQAVQKNKLDPDTVRSHLKAIGAWDAYVRSRNKTLGASDEEISAQIARDGTNAKITDYDLRQVVFVLPVNASAAVVDGRLKEAQALRGRFSDCDTGLPLARGMQDVAVKERLSKTSDTLNQALRKLLADVPNGHLTPPQRTPSGIEMVAVCNRSEDSDQSSLRDRVATEVTNGKLVGESARMYKDVRASAVLSRN